MIEEEPQLTIHTLKLKTPLSRSIIESAPRQIVHQGHGVGASIYLIEMEGRKIAIKDFYNTPLLFKNLIAPYLIHRETRALQRLQGVRGVPEFYGRLDRFAFALEYVEGKPISELAPEELTQDIFVQVQQAIDGIHERHVSHGDLKRRTNFIVTPDGRVIVVDYASAVIGGRWWRPVTNWIQQQMAQIDNKAVAKIKKLGAPDLMTQQEWELLNQPTSLEKWAKKLLKR
jgi:predicted Ser/Thr protein kinase